MFERPEDILKELWEADSTLDIACMPVGGRELVCRAILAERARPGADAPSQVLPYAAATVDLTGCEHISLDVARIEAIAAAGSNGSTEVVYLYAAPAPSPQTLLSGLDEATKQKLREALRFSASRSVVTAEDERRILSALETTAPAQPLQVTNPTTIAQFVGVLADHGVKLPLLETDEDVGTLVDADGKPVLVVDVDRERSDDDVAWIVGMIQVAINTCGGFKAQRRDTTEGQP